MPELYLAANVLFDTQFHEIQIISKFVGIVMNSLGKNNIFASWNCSCHRGHSLYLGKRSGRSHSLPNPSEGPGEHGRCYNWQHVNHVYWPFVQKLYNCLGWAASRLDFFLYKHLGLLFLFEISHLTNIWYSRLLIVTITLIAATTVT